MADVTINSEVNLKLTQKEFTLVLKGLAGKLKRADSLEALVLNMRLLEQRNSYLAELLRQSSGALEAAKAEHGTKMAELEATTRGPKEDGDDGEGEGAG